MNLKSLIIKIIVKYYPANWKINKTKRSILIFEKDVFRRHKFEEYIDKHNLLDKYNIKIAKNKLEFLKCSSYANVIYSYGLSKFINTDNLILLYIGTVGAISIQTNTFKFKMIHPPNYAYKHIANYIFTGILLFERKFISLDHVKKHKKWEQKAFIENIKTFDELKVGFWGLGKVGLYCASLFSRIGAEVHAFDINSDKIDVPGSFIMYSKENWETMLALVDYFVITISNDKTNEKLIGKSILDKMHPGLVIVNVVRGNIIDEKELIYYLEKKKLRGAILDVFEKEPLSKNSKFWRLNNVIITPHIAGNINFVFENIIDNFFTEIQKDV